MERELSKYLARFHAKRNVQHPSLKMIETWRATLNKYNNIGLSKPFDTLNHNLPLCKLKAYGFNKNDLTFIQSYFTHIYQRTAVGDKQMVKDLNR